MIKIVKLTALFAVTILVFSGCAGKKVGAGRVYTIDPDKGLCKRYRTSPATVKVTPPFSGRDMDNTKILYSEDRYALEGYALSRWSDTPSGMLQRAMTEALDASRIYRNTVSSRIKTRKDYLLQSEIREFRQVFDNNASYGVLRIRMYLLDSRSGRLISSRGFGYRVKASSNDTYGAVESLNRAVSMMLRDMCRWLSRVH